MTTSFLAAHSRPGKRAAGALGIALVCWLPAACAGGPDIREDMVGVLHQLADGYKNRDADAIVALYSDDFQVTDPLDRTFAATSELDGIRATEATASGDRGALRQLLARELAGYASIDKAKFVLDGVRRTDDGWEVDTWFRLRATRPGGQRHREESWQRLLMRAHGSEWRIQKQVVLRRDETDGPGNQFVDRTAAVGLQLTHRTHTPIAADTPIIPGNFSGSGVSAGDVDGDGYLDVLVGDGVRSRLFHNRGDGTFEDVTERALGGTAIGSVRGAYLVDLDGDGQLDVFFTRVKQPLVFLRNRGELRFEDASAGVVLARPAQAESAAFGDLDGDGDLDIYVVRYGDFAETSWAYPLYDSTDGVPSSVLRNDGNGHFSEIEVPALTPPGWGLACALGDYDGDGDLDVYLANDFGVNHLLRNDGGWKFTDVTDTAGVADQGLGMSAAFGDYDNDGDLDLYVANMHSSARWVFEGGNFPLPMVADLLFLRGFVRSEMRKVTRGNSLYENRGDGTFVQVAAARNVERNGWSWGANFLDYDNDGDLDIYCPNGFITGTDPNDC